MEDISMTTAPPCGDGPGNHSGLEVTAKPVVRLLLLEDDDSDAALISISLRRNAREKIELHRVPSIGEFLALPRPLSYGIALLDLHLPDGRSDELLPGLTASADFPVIIMTGGGDQETAVSAMKAGALDYLVKSHEAFSNIHSTVERALREWKLRRERASALEALHESEKLYRMLSEHSTDAVFLTDGQGLILAANKAASIMFGKAEQQFRELRWDGLHGPNRALEPLRFSGEAELHRELEFKRTSGESFSAEVVSRTFSDAHGDMKIVHIVRDVTERKHLESALRANSILPGVIYSFRLDAEGRGSIPHASAALAQMFGIHPHAFAEDAGVILKFVHPADAGKFQESIRVSAQNLSTWRHTWRMTHPTIGELWVEGCSTPRREPGGVTVWHGFVHDVTARVIAEQKLRSATQFNQAVLDGLSAHICVLDGEGRIVATNRAWQQNAARSLNTDARATDLTVGALYVDVSEAGAGVPSGTADCLATTARSVAAGQPAVLHQEYPATASREGAWFEAAITPIAGEEPARVIVSHWDITERKKSESVMAARLRLLELADRGDMAHMLSVTLSEAAALTGSSAGLCYANEGDEGELLFRASLPEGCTPLAASETGQHPPLVQRCVSEARPVLLNETVPGHANMAPSCVRCLAVPVIRGGKVKAVFALADKPHDYSDLDAQTTSSLADLAWDIAEKRHAVEKLRERGEQLRNLSVRLEQLREDERTRIAREIHDELGQMLTALKMDMRWMKEELNAGQNSSGQLSAVLGKLDESAGLVDETVAAVQRIAAELRPGILDKLGLPMALTYELRQFQNRTGIACSAQFADDSLDVAPDTATALFRISQEALTNVARHAHATKVELTLKPDGSFLVLRISDNGSGFRKAEAGPRASLGLLGMRERAAQLGGEVLFEAGAGPGVAVICRVPLKFAAQPECVANGAV